MPAKSLTTIDVNPTRYSRKAAQEAFLVELMRGSRIKDALLKIERSARTYETWRRNDEEFRAQVDSVMGRTGRTVTGATPVREVKDPKTLTFEEFSERYLGQRVFDHMGNVVDLIEGRPPRWLHPAMTYTEGEKDLVVINVPPEHGKSTTITMNYATYRICMDPNVRICIVSKTQAMAKKFLLGIKSRLTHPQYRELITTYAPAGGFDADSASWTAERIYVSGRDAEDAHPTCQAVGITGHIYGSRADLFILDDCVDLANAHSWGDQIDWIEAEVMSRIDANGSLLVIGTRLAAMDLYIELMNADRYSDGECPWTRLAMPALLEPADDPKDWVTLWPYSNTQARGLQECDKTPDGLWPKWDGPRLSKKRRRVKPTTWARVYQQRQVAEDTVFDPADVHGCINPRRQVGRIPKNWAGVRPGGMDGLIVVAGLDPATTGFTAAAVIGLDLSTQRRYLLDVRNKAHLGTRPDELRQLIYDLTDTYGILEWVIEKNGFQGFLANDREVRSYITSRGGVVRPHYTGQIKRDPDYGVAAMSGLFKGHAEGHNLIELPNPSASEGIKALVEQLVSWMPDAPRGQLTDTVMALWMAELACIDRINALSGIAGGHMRNRALSARARNRRSAVNLAEHEWRAMA